MCLPYALLHCLPVSQKWDATLIWVSKLIYIFTADSYKFLISNFLQVCHLFCGETEIEKLCFILSNSDDIVTRLLSSVRIF